MGKRSCYLVNHEVEVVQDGQGEVGHTHDELDRLFSVLVTILGGTKVLETPQDFCNRIRKMVTPGQGRELVVKTINSAWD